MIIDTTITKEQSLVLQGLLAPQKHINAKYFYDEHGSQLFEKITRLDEYYPTRTEIKIIKQHAPEITELIQENSLLIEPGAGSCEKVQLLLNYLKLQAYLPQDISESFLKEATIKLNQAFPSLLVSPLISDFSHPIEVPEHLSQYAKYVFYPGSTLGNFEHNNAIKFLTQMSQLIGRCGGMILGVDMHKDTNTLELAYNDSQGVTAKFNLNILQNINRLLKCDINANNFYHRAHYNTELKRIEMHLYSNCRQQYDVLGETITFKKGESIHTENSYKYTIEDIHWLADQSGFELVKSWHDEKHLFSVNFLQVR